MEAVIRIKFYEEKQRDVKKIMIRFLNGQDKLFKTGYCRLFRKGDLLYMTDSVERGVKITDGVMTTSRADIVDDLKRFAGYYPQTHFGGMPGRIYVDFNEKMDADLDKKEEAIMEPVRVDRPEPITPEVKPKAESKANARDAILQNLLMASIKDENIKIAKDVVKVMEWLKEKEDG